MIYLAASGLKLETLGTGVPSRRGLCCWPWARAESHGPSGCRMWAWLSCGTGVSVPRSNPRHLHLQGGLLTTGPLGKSHPFIIWKKKSKTSEKYTLGKLTQLGKEHLWRPTSSLTEYWENQILKSSVIKKTLEFYFPWCTLFILAIF